MVYLDTPDTVKVRIILPLFATSDNGFTMFSWDHLLEFTNQLLLVSPVAIALLVFFFSGIFKFKDKILNFLFLGTAISVVFIFVFNSVLGAADWDLRSFPAVFYVPLGGLLFIRRARGWKNYKNCALLLIFVSFFHLVPWIMVHTDKGKAVDHYQLIRTSDPHPEDWTHYNVFKIARFLKMSGYGERVENLYKDAIKENPQEKRNYFNLASLLCKQKRYVEAESLLVRVTTLYPEYHRAYCMLGRIYELRGDLRQSLYYYLNSMPEKYDNMEFVKKLCGLYLELGKLNKFMEYLELMVSSNPQLPEVHRNLGYVYFLMKKYKKAKEHWENTLEMNPGDLFCRSALVTLKKKEMISFSSND
jgi:tetratricopeptide (TPR) repeat protein